MKYKLGPRKYRAFQAQVDRAEQFFMSPSEMFQVTEEREAGMLYIPWNVFVDILWDLIEGIKK